MGLTIEGAVFNDKFALEDSTERMVQSEGFILKLSFYSQPLAKNGEFCKLDKDINIQEEGGTKKLMERLHLENTQEGANKVLIPIYKYKRRNDKYFITSVYLDSAF